MNLDEIDAVQEKRFYVVQKMIDIIRMMILDHKIYCVDVKPGNFVLNPMDLISGSVAISPYEGVASNAYFIFSIKERKDGLQLNARYFEYLFWSHYRQGIFFPFGKGLGRPEQGGGRWTLNRETLSDFPIPVPPIDEQNLIVEKLDAEFARIAEQLVLLEKMTDAISKEKLSIAVQELYKKKAGK